MIGLLVPEQIPYIVYISRGPNFAHLLIIYIFRGSNFRGSPPRENIKKSINNSILYGWNTVKHIWNLLAYIDTGIYNYSVRASMNNKYLINTTTSLLQIHTCINNWSTDHLLLILIYWKSVKNAIFKPLNNNIPGRLNILLHG